MSAPRSSGARSSATGPAPRSSASWWSVERVPQQDVGRQLGLVGGNASWALFGLYAGVTVTLATLFGRPVSMQPSGIAVIVALLVGAFLIVSPSVTPLPRWRVVVNVLIVVAAVATITWQQPFHDHSPGPSAWELGSANFLLFGLALRGRVLAAWIGEALMMAVICGWSVVVAGSPLYGLGFSYGQPISLIAGTIFAIALQRAAQRIIDFRAAERIRAGEQARDSAVSAARDAELWLVRDLAEPVLRQIADGEHPDRDGVRTLEAALRDVLRGRALAIEPLVGALRRARQRGVDVVLLDDLGDAPVFDSGLRAAVEWAAGRLDELDARLVTIRLAAHPGGAIVTMVDDAGGREERELRSDRGRQLTRD